MPLVFYPSLFGYKLHPYFQSSHVFNSEAAQLFTNGEASLNQSILLIDSRGNIWNNNLSVYLTAVEPSNLRRCSEFFSEWNKIQARSCVPDGMQQLRWPTLRSGLIHLILDFAHGNMNQSMPGSHPDGSLRRLFVPIALLDATLTKSPSLNRKATAITTDMFWRRLSIWCTIVGKSQISSCHLFPSAPKLRGCELLSYPQLSHIDTRGLMGLFAYLIYGPNCLLDVLRDANLSLWTHLKIVPQCYSASLYRSVFDRGRKIVDLPLCTCVNGMLFVLPSSYAYYDVRILSSLFTCTSFWCQSRVKILPPLEVSVTSSSNGICFESPVLCGKGIPRIVYSWVPHFGSTRSAISSSSMEK